MKYCNVCGERKITLVDHLAAFGFLLWAFVAGWKFNDVRYFELLNPSIEWAWVFEFLVLYLGLVVILGVVIIMFLERQAKLSQ